MRTNTRVLAALTLLSSATTALADGRNPGSLLLFPECGNRSIALTCVTVTKTNGHLTPNDTLTLLTWAHPPGQDQGFVYAMLIVIIDTHGAANLPFESPKGNGLRNGALFPTGPYGDGDPTPVNNDDQ